MAIASRRANLFHASTPHLTFSARITVRFGDADAAGLAYYPVLFHHCHAAMEEFFAARCGVPYDELVSRRRVGFPTVNVRAGFFAPLVYGDEVLVEVWVSRVGRSSATFEYRLRRTRDALQPARRGAWAGLHFLLHKAVRVRRPEGDARTTPPARLTPRRAPRLHARALRL